MKSFYQFVLTYRGANSELGYFAEEVFEDSMFPRASTSFAELSEYIELQASEYMSTKSFDELWEIYANKYSI